MTRIYRIELPDGSGPFWRTTGSYIYDDNRAGGPSASYHPGPTSMSLDCQLSEDTSQLGDFYSDGLCQHDNRGRAKIRYQFAFASLDQLREWFPDVDGRAAMKEAGFEISVYDIPEDDLVVGHYQVAFHPEDATHVNSLDIETFEAVQLELALA